MSRRPLHRLVDIAQALDAISAHLERGGLDDGLIFDAVRMRLVEIGEAVKDLPAEVLAMEPDVPWRDIAGMREWLAHHCFDTAHSVVGATVSTELAALGAAVERLRRRITP